MEGGFTDNLNDLNSNDSAKAGNQMSMNDQQLQQQSMTQRTEMNDIVLPDIVTGGKPGSGSIQA